MRLLSAIAARWRNLGYGFLFLPGAIALALVGLGVVLTWVDGRLSGDIGFGGDASAARSILSTIAASLITVAGVVFSITILSLQLVSQQFTPRAIRTFLGDRFNQVVAGTFVGIFGYALVVLRAVRNGDEQSPDFVPSLSVTFAIALALLALGVLLAFIHHMSQSIQVSRIAARIARSTLSALDKSYPQPFGHAADEPSEDVLAAWYEEEPAVVFPSRPGYVQSIALDDLPGPLGQRGTRLHIRVAPGDFVTEATALAAAWPPGDQEGLERAIRATVAVESERDIAQDALYGVRQLADIAIKAISPSINDPTTAWTAIHYVQAALERLAARALPPEVRRYPDDVVVVAKRHAFDEYVEAGFVQVGRYATRDARVAGALLDAVARVAELAREAGAHDRLLSLREAATTIAEPAAGEARTAYDREAVEERRERVERAVSGGLGGR